MLNVYELRQYTMRPGRRDTLIELFDAKFLESQEATGMRIVGQFRDLDDPDRFVWVRAFRDMESRAEALTAFYGGPVWRANRDAANETMVDSDDVLLLRPAPEGFAPDDRTRPAVGAPAIAPSLVVASIYHGEIDDEFVRYFHDHAAPLLAKAGAPPLAGLRTEPAKNTFPALPVRRGVNVFVWFASFTDERAYAASLAELAACEPWSNDVLPEILKRLSSPPERLRLAPTARSLLR